MKRMGASCVLAGLLLASILVAGAGTGPPSQAQAGEPAFLTLLNFTNASRLVRIEVLSSGGSVVSADVRSLPLGDVLTIDLDLGPDPVTYRTSCTGCATVVFGLAAGQRALAYVVAPGDPLSARSDLRVSNESGATRVGALRTGTALGSGRTLLGFDLDAEQVDTVGVRLRPGRTVDLNLVCAGCVPQLVRLGNGVDLEVPLR